MGDSLRVMRIAPQFVDAAYAVFPSGDSVWVGTPRGVFIAVSGEEDLTRPAGMTAASLQAPVYGFATLGDTLVALDGESVRQMDDLMALLSGDRVGKTVTARLLRGGQLQETQVTVGEHD